MDDKDRVFARFKDDKPEAADRRELLTIPTRAGAIGSRVVEVVHVRSGWAVRDRPRRIDTHVRAASWEGGFPAKQVAAPAALMEQGTNEPATAIAHVMPAWEPAPDEAEGASSASAPVRPARLGPGQPRKYGPLSSPRHFADPFDTSDDGANCMRCGYVIEGAREQRGLMTCAGCG